MSSQLEKGHIDIPNILRYTETCIVFLPPTEICPYGGMFSEQRQKGLLKRNAALHAFVNSPFLSDK